MLFLFAACAIGSTSLARLAPAELAGTWTTDPADPQRSGESELLLKEDPETPDLLHILDSTPVPTVYHGAYRINGDTMIRLPNGRPEDPYRELSWQRQGDELVVTHGGAWRPKAYVGTRLVRLLPDPFFDAVRAGDMETLQARPNLRKDIETSVDQIGRTALYVATIKRQPRVLKLLLDTGAPLDIRNRNLWGDTALHAAVRHGDPECLSLLLEYGMDVNTPAANGRTPLMAAGETSGNYGLMLEILLTAGATPDATNALGETAREILVRAGATKFIRIFDAQLEAHRRRQAPGA